MSGGIGVIDRFRQNTEDLRNSPLLFENNKGVKGQVIRPAGDSHKRDYIEALTHPTETHLHSRVDLEQVFSDMSIEDVQDIYLSLRHLFTDQCNNEHRLRIVVCFRNVSKSEWPELVKQISFIMPLGTAGHDVMWATEILTSTYPYYRVQLINTANRLFTYDTLTVERGYILAALAKLPLQDLQKIDKYDETEREEFRKRHVPQNLKDGARISYVFDPVLGKGWNTK